MEAGASVCRTARRQCTRGVYPWLIIVWLFHFFSFCSSTRLTTFGYGYVISGFFFCRLPKLWIFIHTSNNLLHISFVLFSLSLSPSTYHLPNYTPSQPLLPPFFSFIHFFSLSLYSTLHFTTFPHDIFLT